MDFETRKGKFELAYVIVVIFGINHRFMMLDDHFNLVRDDLEVCMLWA